MKKREVKNSLPPTRSIIQVMPGGKVRLDPSIIPDLAAWLIYRERQFRHQSAPPELASLGKIDPEKAARAAYYRNGANALATVINQLLDSWPLEAYERCRAVFMAAADPDQVGRDGTASARLGGTDDRPAKERYVRRTPNGKRPSAFES